MNSFDENYKSLLKEILENGNVKSDRTGTGTISLFGKQLRHNMSEGFPLMTTKKMYWKGIVTELLWFLRGDTSIEYLLKNDCNIWNGDAYKAYLNRDSDFYDFLLEGNSKGGFRDLTLEEFINKIKTDSEFCEKFGDLGKIYGHQWRNWNSDIPLGEETSSLDRGIDQIVNLIKDIKTNPDSRRLRVTAWNPEQLNECVLPPCHTDFQIYTRELSLDERISLVKAMPNLNTHQDCDTLNIPKRSISLLFNMRSNDFALGNPFNVPSYALLLVILGEIVNMVPEELICNMGDVHIYSNHVDGIKEQLTRTSFKLPNLRFSDNFKLMVKKFNGTNDGGIDYGYYNKFTNFIETLDHSDFIIENYECHPAIKMPLSN